MKSNSSPIKYLILKIKFFIFQNSDSDIESGMDGKRLFIDCNPSKFIVFSSLFLFAIFLSLKLGNVQSFWRKTVKNILYWSSNSEQLKDNEIDWSLWWVLCPLWVWKGFVIVGGIVGSISYCNDRDSNPETKTEFKAMLIALFIHSILLFFEILLCYQVKSTSQAITHATTF